MIQGEKELVQEDKELLLKYLSMALPYEVICDRLGYPYILVEIDIQRALVYLLRDETYVPYSISRGDIIKPYLRPLSSMTEEEKREYKHLIAFSGNPIGSANLINWLNKHHFDYLGLIEKGLAIKVTKENNPYKD